jgi:subtilisin family serine protease
MVSGIIAGQKNSSAPGGIAPKAKIISIDNTDGGSEGLIAAMEWVLTIRKKYNVVAVSGSVGAPNSSGLRGGEGDCSLDPILSEKIKELVNAGIVMIFASGNGGSVSKLDFPACLPGVVSVGALNSKGSIAVYSNISKSLTVLAPAEILSSNGDAGYFIGGGTSSATPIVAGAVALLKQAKPDATPQEIKLALQSTRNRISDVLWANLPILNLPTAIEAIQTGKFELLPITPIGNVTPSPAPTVTLTPTPAPTVTILLRQITCTKGKLTKKVTAVKPVCPAGYKKK